MIIRIKEKKSESSIDKKEKFIRKKENKKRRRKERVEVEESRERE